jgi:hypothetical protein
MEWGYLLMAYDKVVDSAKLDGAIKATADGIRETTNYSEDIPWDAERGFAGPVIGLVSGAVSNSYSQGYSEGYSLGNEGGYNQGYAEGESVGKQEEHEAFWNNAIGGAERIEGIQLFAGRCWNDDTFKPPRVITITQKCNYCFYDNRVTDITPYVKFEAVDALSSAFQYSKTKKIPHIDASKVSSLTSSFANSQVETIEGLTVSELTKFSYTFSSASKLTHVIFYGTIAMNGLNLQWSPLDHDSLISIVNALADKTADTSGTRWVVTIGASNFAKLTDEEKMIAMQKGWDIE